MEQENKNDYQKDDVQVGVGHMNFSQAKTAQIPAAFGSLKAGEEQADSSGNSEQHVYRWV